MKGWIDGHLYRIFVGSTSRFSGFRSHADLRDERNVSFICFALPWKGRLINEVHTEREEKP